MIEGIEYTSLNKANERNAFFKAQVEGAEEGSTTCDKWSEVTEHPGGGKWAILYDERIKDFLGEGEEVTDISAYFPFTDPAG